MKSKSLKANKLFCDNHHRTSLLADKTLKFIVFSLFLLLTVNVNMRGQSVDAFNPGVDRMVLAFAEQVDGKILIGGMFSGVYGQPHRYIARLNADGTLDTSFNLNLDDFVSTMIRQSDGKILLGGRFSSIDGQRRHKIARLNPDGSLDMSFNPGAHDGALDIVYSLALQPDGRIIAGGDFRRTGVSIFENYRGVERFNPDGSLDSSFNVNTNGPIYTVAIQRDGRILIGGGFTNVNGQERRNIASLLPNGSLDTSFNVNSTGAVEIIYIQKDGRILIGGKMLSSPAEQEPVSLIRLLMDGTFDTSFSAKINGPVYAVAEQSDGKILVGGRMLFMTGTQESINLARLNINGTLDTSFYGNTSGPIETITVQADGKILISGDFSVTKDQPRIKIARLYETSITPTPPNISSVTYDAVNEFSSTNNVNAMWSYGFKLAPNSFIPFTSLGQPWSGTSSWSPNPNGECCALVMKNTSGTSQMFAGQIAHPPDLLNLHPGANGERAAVKWTAPAAGTYQIQGRFQGIDIAGTSSSAHILHNGVEIWTSAINGYNAQAPYNLTLNLAAGDAIEFAVGYGDNNQYYSDSTGLAARITRVGDFTGNNPTGTAPATPLASYSAVNEFSSTNNVNGMWSYGFKLAPNSFVPFTSLGQPWSGTSSWSPNPDGSCCALVMKNTSGASQTFAGVIAQPPDLLNLHPGANGERAAVKWVAPAAGTYQIQGRFQGIDITGTSSSGHILHNGVEIWTSAINGYNAQAPYNLTLNLAAGDAIEFAVGYGDNNQYYNDSTGLAANITRVGGGVVVPSPTSPGNYNAVNDFSSTNNVNGMWSYGFKLAANSFIPFSTLGQPWGGTSSWSPNPNGECCALVMKNVSGSAQLFAGVIAQPPDLLNLHPGANGERAAVKWTAPAAGTYQIQGRFQGIDIAGTSSSGHILHNGVEIWTSAINGYNAQAPYNLTLNLAAGDAIEFAVGYGDNNQYYNDSTGLAANITRVSGN